MSEIGAEKVRVWRNDALPGVDLMRARYTRHSFSRHFHEGYCLGIIESGALAFRYRGENLVAPAGSVNLAVPGEVHDGHGACASGWSYRMLYMEPESLAAVANQLAAHPNESPVSAPQRLPHFRPGVIHDPAFAARLHRLHHGLEVGHYSDLETQTHFLSLMAHWIRGYADDRPQPPAIDSEHRAVRRVRTLLEDCYAEEVSLDDLARETGLSPYHLTRTFTRELGIPPHAYLIQVRVNRAAQRMTGRESLAEIAAAVGFADQSHLNRHFKRLRGTTPGAYRKIVQDQ